MHRRNSLLALAALGAAAASPWARAQQKNRLPRVAILHSGAAANLIKRSEVFTRAMRELGYEDGRNVQVQWLSANGQSDLLAEMAAQLGRESPEVIVSASAITTRALQAVSQRIPIVMAAAEDPVAEGFVRSLTHTGNNVTGVSTSVLDQLRRQIELLSEVAPRLRRVTALLNPTNPIYKTYRARVEFNVPGGLRLAVVDASTPKEMERAFTRARDDTEGVLVMNDPDYYTLRREVTEQALSSRRPTIYPLRGYVEAGGLLSWGPNTEANFARTAWYVDRILKGAKPAELPIETPSRFELVANRATARLLGITLPADILKQASVIGTA
ncbi:MAG TPA: ABC transporter substrate-binding protein [Usitatibacter sp.]|nr:ABC transporter substrate-binding protein [Usitatibacter sp.]